MVKGKKIRVRVRTTNSIYEGDIFLPSMRNRVSDLLNDDKMTFISLTTVKIDNAKEHEDFIALNKQFIESLTILD